MVPIRLHRVLPIVLDHLDESLSVACLIVNLDYIVLVVQRCVLDGCLFVEYAHVHVEIGRRHV